MAKIKIVPAKNGQYYLRIVAGNGETVLHSETYISKPNAKRAAERIHPLMLSATIEDVEAEALKAFTNYFRR